MLQAEVEVFVEAEASSRGVFLLVRNALLAGRMKDAPDLLVPEKIYFTPHPSARDTCDSVYERFIRLGDLLEKLPN